MSSYTSLPFVLYCGRLSRAYTKITPFISKRTVYKLFSQASYLALSSYAAIEHEQPSCIGGAFTPIFICDSLKCFPFRAAQTGQQFLFAITVYSLKPFRRNLSRCARIWSRAESLWRGACFGGFERKSNNPILLPFPLSRLLDMQAAIIQSSNKHSKINPSICRLF